MQAPDLNSSYLSSLTSARDIADQAARMVNEVRRISKSSEQVHDDQVRADLQASVRALTQQLREVQDALDGLSRNSKRTVR